MGVILVESTTVQNSAGQMIASAAKVIPNGGDWSRESPPKCPEKIRFWNHKKICRVGRVFVS